MSSSRPGLFCTCHYKILLAKVQMEFTMSEATITFRVPADLKERFSEAARRHDRAGSQVLRDFMRSFVDQPTDAPAYDAWFRAQVQDALDDPRRPVASKAVEQSFARRRAAVRRKLATRAR